MAPPHVLLATRPDITERNVSPTEELVAFDSRNLGVPEAEIAGMAHRAEQLGRIRIAKEAIASAAAETPTTVVSTSDDGA